MELAPFITSLWTSIEKFPNAQWKTALSYGQLQSKEWLITEANRVYSDRKFTTAFVIGGWYGLLPALWKQSDFCPVKNFRSIDRDETCAAISESINKKWVIADWQFKATTADAFALDYQKTPMTVFKQNGEKVTLIETPDLIINTSCEHFPDISLWLERIPAGTDLILQSNNFSHDPQHVNCAKSLKDFLSQVSLNTVHSASELPLANYTRYMVIGKK